MSLIYSASTKVNFTERDICMTEVGIMDNFNRIKGARSLVIIWIVTVLISYITVNAFAARMCWLVISQLMPLRHGCPATVAVGSRTYM